MLPKDGVAKYTFPIVHKENKHLLAVEYTSWEALLLGMPSNCLIWRDETGSKNESGDVDIPSNESDFNDNKAPEHFDDWMVSLPANNRKN